MNKTRRKEIQEQINILSSVLDRLEDISRDEHKCWYNIPVSFMDSDISLKSIAAYEDIDTALDWVDNTISVLQSANK